MHHHTSFNSLFFFLTFFIFLFPNNSFTQNKNLEVLSSEQLVADSLHQEITNYMHSFKNSREDKNQLLIRYKKSASQSTQKQRYHFYSSLIDLTSNDNTSALISLNKALSYNTLSADLNSDLHLYLGRIYSSDKNDSLAIPHFQNSIELARKSGQQSKIVRGQVELASAYQSTNELFKAIQLLDSAKNYFTIHLLPKNLAIVHFHLASCYLKQKKYEDCLNEIDKSEQLGNSPEFFIGGALIKSEVAFQQKDYHLGIKHANYAYQSATEFNIDTYQLEALKLLSNIYAQNNQSDSAYLYLHTYDSLKDFSTDNKYFNTLRQIESSYEVREQKRKVLLLKEEKKNEKIKQYNIILSLITITSILVVCLLLLFLRSNRQKLNIKSKDFELQKTNHGLEIAISKLEGFKRQVTQKNELIIHLEKGLRSRDQSAYIDSLRNSLILTKNDLSDFFELFNNTYPLFLDYIKANTPNLTRNDQVLIALIFLNIKNSEQSCILGISLDSLRKARYRLKKKLLISDAESINEYIQNLHREYTREHFSKIEPPI